LYVVAGAKLHENLGRDRILRLALRDHHTDATPGFRRMGGAGSSDGRVTIHGWVLLVNEVTGHPVGIPLGGGCVKGGDQIGFYGSPAIVRE
jgi:hypothetical protein